MQVACSRASHLLLLCLASAPLCHLHMLGCQWQSWLASQRRGYAECSGTKTHPKEEVSGRISLRTSAPKLRSGRQNSGKQAFKHGHPPRTSMKNFGLKNFGLIFRSPDLATHQTHHQRSFWNPATHVHDTSRKF